MNDKDGILVIKYDNLQNRFHELFQEKNKLNDENKKLRKIIARLQEENTLLKKSKQELMNILDKQR